MINPGAQGSGLSQAMARGRSNSSTSPRSSSSSFSSVQQPQPQQHQHEVTATSGGESLPLLNLHADSGNGSGNGSFTGLNRNNSGLVRGRQPWRCCGASCGTRAAYVLTFLLVLCAVCTRREDALPRPNEGRQPASTPTPREWTRRWESRGNGRREMKSGKPTVCSGG